MVGGYEMLLFCVVSFDRASASDVKGLVVEVVLLVAMAVVGSGASELIRAAFDLVEK